MPYIGGATVAAASILPVTSGAWVMLRPIDEVTGLILLAINVASILYTVGVVSRYAINTKRGN